MTVAQKMRLAGFKASLRARGAMLRTNAGTVVAALIQDMPELPDPDGNAKKELPVYASIHCLRGTVAQPRAVTHFAPVESTTRTYRVLRYEESAANVVSESWFCEATRT